MERGPGVVRLEGQEARRAEGPLPNPLARTSVAVLISMASTISTPL